MYIPPAFKMNDEEELLSFVRKHPFGILVTQAGGECMATHLPVVPDASGNRMLCGHVASQNPQSAAIVAGAPALLIFSGPHAYVSSSWYNHLNVPTWNYMAVHVYGRLRVQQPEALKASLVQLVDRHESGSENRVDVRHMPPDFVSRMMLGITGFELLIERMEGNYKLSQNRNEEDHRSVVSHLENSGDGDARAVASAMQKFRKGHEG